MKNVEETTPLLIKNPINPNDQVLPTKPNNERLMTEEVLLSSVDPLWIAIRIVGFVTFWTVLMTMFVASITIVILTPGCVSENSTDLHNSTMNSSNKAL